MINVREGSTEDARRKVVTLTKRGCDFRIHSLKEAQELDNFFSDVLFEEDFAAFHKIYEKLRKALEE